VVFMLLEDELETINVIVPPPVYERHRLVVRTASFVRITGRMERREGTLNVVASALESLSRPALPAADVHHIEPPQERETGRDAAVADLAAALPAAHSFGRRGR
jgi:DNA polymerase III alpha subunit